MTTYVGANIGTVENSINTRYFYGLRKLEDGTVYLAVVDQLNPSDIIEINVPGNSAENYNDFDIGQDFFEGRDVNHEKVYANLKYEQYRWDYQKVNYYINDDGNLVARVNQPYNYT
tara:strand:- start:154 stop:501 length:348 start_codon:yes stop_codon:yes gene_type:complete